MLDFKAVIITGAIKSGKVRALWRDGILKLFNEKGKTMQVQSSQPTRRKFWRSTWDADTERGPVTLSVKCMTCGGWWRVAMQDAETLWQGNAG